MLNLFPVFILIAIALVVVFTELIKMLDRKNRLKGYRVWIPAVLSAAVTCLMHYGDFFNPPRQAWFWWASIFAFSIFAYEAVLKKITVSLGIDADASGKKGEG